MATKQVQRKRPEIEVITDPDLVAGEKERPLLTFTTGIGSTFLVKINQPAGRALLIAVHL